MVIIPKQVAAVLSPAVTLCSLLIFWFRLQSAWYIQLAFAIAVTGIFLGVFGLGSKHRRFAIAGIITGILPFVLFLATFGMFFFFDR